MFGILKNLFFYFSFTDVSSDGIYLSILFNRDFDLMKNTGIFINPVQSGVDTEIFKEARAKFTGRFVRVNFHTYKTAVNVGDQREENWEDVVTMENLNEIANSFLDDNDEDDEDEVI